MSMLLLLLLALLAAHCDACTSWHNCPTKCANGTSENDLLAFLTAFETSVRSLRACPVALDRLSD